MGGASVGHARVGDAARLRVPRRALLRALGRRQHRAGDDADGGRSSAVWGTDKTGHWTLGVLISVAAGAATGLLHAFFSVTLRATRSSAVARRSTSSRSGSPGTCSFASTESAERLPRASRRCPTARSTSSTTFRPTASAASSAMPSRTRTTSSGRRWRWSSSPWVAVFKTPAGLRLRSVGEHPRAADTVGINVYLTRYAAVTLSGCAGGGGGRVSRARLRELVRAQHDSRTRDSSSSLPSSSGAGSRLAHLSHAFCSGSSSALATSLQEYSLSVSTLFEALPYVLTLVAVAGVIGRSIPPAAIGRPYVKQ